MTCIWLLSPPFQQKLLLIKALASLCTNNNIQLHGKDQSAVACIDKIISPCELVTRKYVF